jgi:hypothetical protein
MSMALRRLHIRFREPVDPQPLAAVPGVSLLEQANTHIIVQVEGEMTG